MRQFAKCDAGGFLEKHNHFISVYVGKIQFSANKIITFFYMHNKFNIDTICALIV